MAQLSIFDVPVNVELTEETEKEPIDISGPQITSVMDEHVVDFIS